MKTFVLGDIHRAAKVLEQCFERSGFDKKNDLLIQLGDVVDRHDEVFECVEILFQVDNLIALKGNHDVWFADFLRTDAHPRDWIYGGLDTVKSYLKHAGKEEVFSEEGEGYATNLVALDVPASHQEFFARQQLYYVDNQNRCFVHGGFRPRLPMNQQHPEDFYWDRFLWQNAYKHKRMFGDDEYPGSAFRGRWRASPKNNGIKVRPGCGIVFMLEFFGTLPKPIAELGAGIKAFRQKRNR